MSRLLFIPAAFATVLAVGTADWPVPGQAGDAYVAVEDAKAIYSPATDPKTGDDPPALLSLTAVEVATELERLLPSFCFLCMRCVRGHMLVDGPPPPLGGFQGFHPESCGWGTCDMHPSCGGYAASGATLPDLLSRSLMAVDATGLRTLLAELPHRIRIHHGRRVLQLIGCEDQVVASYSVASVPALEMVLQ